MTARTPPEVPISPILIVSGHRDDLGSGVSLAFAYFRRFGAIGRGADHLWASTAMTLPLPLRDSNAVNSEYGDKDADSKKSSDCSCHGHPPINGGRF